MSAASCRAKTHCPRGHPYDAENTYRRANGHRCCRECERERCRKRNARLRERAITTFDRLVLHHGRTKAIVRHKQAMARRARRESRMQLHLDWRSKGFGALVAQLLVDDPASHALNEKARIFKARYHYDAAFRAKELRRRYGQHQTLEDDGTLTPLVVAALFASTHTCPYCLRFMRSKDKTLDHLVPRCRGGWHGIDNVVVCCFSCNASKHHRTPLEYAMGLSVPMPPRMGSNCESAGPGCASHAGAVGVATVAATASSQCIAATNAA